MGPQYKIELTIRYHDKIKKTELIPLLAACVPSDPGHVVDLEHPEVVIFVQIHKVRLFHRRHGHAAPFTVLTLLQTVGGISVVRHYERFKRFNVVQVGDAARRHNRSLKGAGCSEESHVNLNDDRTVT